MKNDIKKFYFIILFLITSSVISWSLYFKGYVAQDTVDIKSFPLRFGDWVGEEIPISEQDMAILETRNVFIRRYKNLQGDEIFLFTVYSQNNRKVSHPPEICYTGSGVTIVDSGKEQIFFREDLQVAANRLTVEGRNDQQLILYWFKVGDAFTSNYWRQQALIAVKSFLGQSASSALVRISIKNTEENTSGNLAKLKGFAQEIFPVVQQYLP